MVKILTLCIELRVVMQSDTSWAGVSALQHRPVLNQGWGQRIATWTGVELSSDVYSNQVIVLKCNWKSYFIRLIIVPALLLGYLIN